MEVAPLPSAGERRREREREARREQEQEPREEQEQRQRALARKRRLEALQVRARRGEPDRRGVATGLQVRLVAWAPLP
jgi:hypothetical protein